MNRELWRWVVKTRLKSRQRRRDLTKEQNNFIQTISAHHANEIEAILVSNGYTLKSATSQQGAKDVVQRVGPQHKKLLTAYLDAGDDGLTNYEAGFTADLLNSCYWKRCSELKLMGHIAATEEKRLNPTSGSHQQVHAITKQGKEWLSDDH